MSPRLSLALEQGGLVLPDDGRIAVFHPRLDMDLSDLPKDRVQIIQPFKPDHDGFAAQGFDCTPTAEGPYTASIICLPRAKALIRAVIHTAASCTDGPLVVDGGKTDGIDSVLKDIRKRTDIGGPVSKAHGKIFWLAAAPDMFQDWRPPETQIVDGFHTAPGVFSADGIDPASAFLVNTLPKQLGKRVADLGAGWGYLARHLLADPKLETLDLVEADHIALDCARLNVTDPRARFHWADATRWTPDHRVDAVVMNPPFHTSRAADPGIGQAFIEAAARCLTPSGTLWMVANRHLPYETTLATRFAHVDSVASNNRFKVLRATRPSRPRR